MMTKKRPKGYGSYWSKDKYKEKNFVDWYVWMYESRLKINKDFISWINNNDIESIADFGCGIGIGFNKAFEDKEYIGIDISERNINWCKKNYKNPKHKYMCMDFIADSLPQKVDVSVCNGTLENVWSINDALRGMVNSSEKWIYASCFMGWYPDLKSHKYSWEDKKKVYSSLISPAESRVVLEDLGCTDIQIFPAKKGLDDESGYETIIIARVSRV